MILIANGRLITRDDAAPYIENGGVAVSGTKIVEVGETAALRAKYPDAEFVDAKGGVIMPAFINAHSHIYSALARGLAMPNYNPTNFYEVLDGMWWRLDRWKIRGRAHTLPTSIPSKQAAQRCLTTMQAIARSKEACLPLRKSQRSWACAPCFAMR